MYNKGFADGVKKYSLAVIIVGFILLFSTIYSK
jgi:hypothetical protein